MFLYLIMHQVTSGKRLPDFGFTSFCILSRFSHIHCTNPVVQTDPNSLVSFNWCPVDAKKQSALIQLLIIAIVPIRTVIAFHKPVF